MHEFKLSPKDAQILEHQNEVLNGIRERLEGLLRDGGKITPGGIIIDATTHKSKTHIQLHQKQIKA